jgi:putative methionine-R-sulfoxide reductase with GAF domain
LSNLILVIFKFLIIEFFKSLIIENFNNLITIDVGAQHLAQNTSFVGFFRHAQMKTILETFVGLLKARTLNHGGLVVDKTTNSDESMK